MAWVFELTLNFPTVIYTVLVGIVLFYWLLMLSGVLKLDLDSKLSSNEFISSFLSAFGLTGSSIAVVISVLVVSSWIITAIFSEVLLTSSSMAGSITGILIGIVILLIAFILSLIMIRLWYKTPETHQTQKIKRGSKPVVVGKICRIISGGVDERFGEAEYDDEDGAVNNLSVRCQAPTRIRRGESALIIEYDAGKDVYWIEPYKDPLV